MGILELETLESLVPKWVSMLCVCMCVCVYADMCVRFYINNDS